MLKWPSFVERGGDTDNCHDGYFRKLVKNRTLHFRTLVRRYLK